MVSWRGFLNPICRRKSSLLVVGLWFMVLQLFVAQKGFSSGCLGMRIKSSIGTVLVARCSMACFVRGQCINSWCSDEMKKQFASILRILSDQKKYKSKNTTSVRGWNPSYLCNANRTKYSHHRLLINSLCCSEGLTTKVACILYISSVEGYF